MRQENEHVSRQFYNDNFTPSGRGRARAIVNAAGRTWDRQATVRHQALQASRTYHDYRGPCPVHRPEGTHSYLGQLFSESSYSRWSSRSHGWSS